MYPLKRRIISVCLSAMLVSSTVTGLTVMSNADNFDYISAIPTTKAPESTTQTETTTQKTIFIAKTGGDEPDTYIFDNYEYVIQNEKNAYITKYTGTDTEDIIIPSKIDGYNITFVDYNSFENHTEIKSVTFPESIEAINSGSFGGCTSLNKITLPDKPLDIYHDAFDNTAYYNDAENWDNGIFYINNKHLIYADPEQVSGDIKVKNGVLDISSHAFEDCVKITGITIPDSVKEIAYSAFENCSSLKKAELSKNISCIPDSIFNGCSSLEAIKIPDGVKEIGYSAFNNCTALKTVSIPESVTILGNSCFKECTSLDSIKIPSAVREIDSYAFSGCSSLQSITVPNRVTELTNGIFENCTSLSDITLPDSIEQIGIDVIKNTAYSNNVNNWTGEFLYIDNYLFNVNVNNLHGKITVKNGTKAIAGYAFAAGNNKESFDEEAKNTTVTEVVLPNTLRFIGCGCFDSCTAINNMIIPDSVTYIDEYAFAGCSSLKDMVIPSSVKKLGYCAFSDCTSLQNVTINASVDSISSNTFTGCGNMESVNVNADNKSLSSENGVLFNKTGTELIYYPVNRNADSYTIPDSVEIISDNAFEGANNLKSISMSDNVTDIYYGVFSYCEKLESIRLSENITKLLGEAFSNCPQLKSIKIPDSVTDICSGLFRDDINLTDIKLGDNVKYFHNSSFENTGYINDESNWKDGVLYLGKYLLKADPSSIPEEYAVKDGTILIASDAFMDCINLKSVTLPDSLKTVCFDAFYGCGFYKITIPATVTVIEEEAFGLFNGGTPIKGFKRTNYIDGFTITGYDGTAANRYADENGLKFISLGTYDCDHTTTQIINKKDAECLNSGYTGDTMCSNCGVILSMGTKIPPVGHKYENGYCTVCGSSRPESTDTDEPSSSVTDEPSSTPSENESTTKAPSTSPSENGIKLIPDSILKVDESKSNITFIPSSTLGMTVSELRKQINGDITVALDDDALIANGTKITCGGVTYILTVKGDAQADGKITASDARAILRIAAKLDTADDITTSAADINSDGKVTSSEARSVLRFSAKLAKTIES